jgi:ATP-dependent RNA helicase DDX10/DBP4
MRPQTPRSARLGKYEKQGKSQFQPKKRKRDEVNIEQLTQAVQELVSLFLELGGHILTISQDPKNGTSKDFTDLPLSGPTKAGLKTCHFVTMTDIQSRAIPLALKGCDVLGAAKTGSGKTLAFVIPVLENLYRAQLAGPDVGLGAMIISPTRELAIQIFDVLHKIGRKGHMFAAGLIIGGKGLQEEQNALMRMNIVVCTPGRMLQHLSQTASFNVDNLQMLVLDEADRILDMGFQRDVDAILDYLPKDRQTMLFSATQTKKVSDLARLSLKEPEYVSVHEDAATATPKSLQQNYVLASLPEKLDTLWSFIQTSKTAKILVFLSSGKQVRFVYESFRHMQPGIPLLHLHGRQKQGTRLEITKKFSSSKTSCLFATDVAARGLDFPAVEWVVQVDCPEDADTYIHRVGRTARYEREGRAILFLDPNEEEGMLKRLESKKVPIEKVNVRQKKKSSIKNQLQNMCFKDPQLKYLGQKAFTSYVRSIYVQKDKEIFQIDKLPLEEYAASLGLPGAPRIKFMKGDDSKARKNAPRATLIDSDDESEFGSGEEGGDAVKVNSKKKEKAVRTKYDRMFERQNQDILAGHYSKMLADDDPPSDASDVKNDFHDEDPSADDFLSVKRTIPAEGDVPDYETGPNRSYKKLVNIAGVKEPILVDSKRAEKRLQSKKKILKYKEKGERLVFDDEGNAHPLYELEGEAKFKERGLPEDQRRRFVDEERQKAAKFDTEDKELVKEKKRAKKEKRKERERREAEAELADDDAVAGGENDALSNFIQDAEGLHSDGADEREDEVRSPKRAKKWFEKDGRKGVESIEEVETFEDLEALASGLLG